MTPNEYQALAARTMPELETQEAFRNCMMGLVGETGEVVDTMKKWMFQSGDAPLPKDKLVEEIGDVFWYCAYALHIIGVGLKSAFTDTDETLGNMTDEDDTVPKRIQLYTCSMLNAFTATNLYMEFDSDAPFYGNILNVVVGLRLMLHLIGSDVGTCFEGNINKLKKRYPDGFDPERSLHREV